MTALNTMSKVRHLSVRWSETLSQCFFFFGHFVFFPRARVGLVKKKVTRNIEKKAHGLIERQFFPNERRREARVHEVTKLISVVVTPASGGPTQFV